MRQTYITICFAFCLFYVSALVTNPAVCNTTIEKFNSAVSQLITNSKNATSQWAVYSNVQSLNGATYALKYACGNASLEVTASQPANATVAEAQACSKLQEIVESFISKKGETSFTGGFGKAFEVNDKVMKAGKELGVECNITLILDEEEEVNDEEEEQENEDDQKNAEDFWAGEDDSGIVEENETLDAQTKDVEVADEPVDVVDADAAFLPVILLSTSKKAKNETGSDWTKDDYQKYTNATEWQNGGYSKYFDQNKTTSGSGSTSQPPKWFF